jgi:hypothetical protein
MVSAGTQQLSVSDIDFALAAQIAVAWAGEAGEESRLGWWRTDMMSEFGGEDLFKRLLPHTWDWAAVQAVREAARRHDALRRSKVHDADTVVSLYHLGFALDERVDERLLELKRTGVAPGLALKHYGELAEESWSLDSFRRWVRDHGESAYEAAPSGRQLKGAPPDSLEQVVRRLVGALDPLPDRYPMPHFRSAR